MKIRYIYLDKQSSNWSMPIPGGDGGGRGVGGVLRFPKGYTGTDGFEGINF